MMLAASAVAESRANANRTIATAVPIDPVATIPSAPSFAFNHDNANAPATAPAPMAPSRNPYSPGPPAICWRAMRGSRAQ